MDKEQLDEVVERLLKRWKGDRFQCGDLEYALGTGYRQDAPTKTQIKGALERVSKKEGFHTDKVGNCRYYWHEEIKESSQDGTRIED